MHVFKVWAPQATRARVQASGTVHEMQRQESGWWAAAVAAAQAGTDYGFLLDDDATVLPDPRSQWQPNGVHGLSRVVDHSQFAWTDGEWQAPPLSSSIFYEMHVGTFTAAGTFDAACERLAYLRDLGVTHVELLPVAAFPGKHGWGYDGVDLFAVHAPYGGPDGLKRFVDACHRHGLAVVMDVVYNHLGPSGNYLGKFGPYFTQLHNTPWGEAVNLEDAGSHEVRRFFCDNALMWLRDYHCDGLRLDAVHAYMDRSALNFMEQLAGEVHGLQGHLRRNLVVIAESDLNDPRLVRASDCGGYGMDAQWSDDFHHALVTLLTGDRGGYYADFGTMGDLAKSIRQAYVYDGSFSKFRNRKHGRPIGELPGPRFLGYSQNHDQVGNRAKGERLWQLCSEGRAKIAAALVLTAPFVPMLFQGEEWAATSPFQYFTDHEDKDLGRLVSEGRKKEFAAFGWDPEEIPDPQAEQTFLQSRLHWKEIDTEPHAGMLRWYKQLIALRHAEQDLTSYDLASVKVRFDEARQWMVVDRGELSVLFTLAAQEQTFEGIQIKTILLSSSPEAKLRNGILTLPSESVAIVRKDGEG